MFFFGGYERLQEDLGTTLITTVPTAAARAGAVSAAVQPYLSLYPLPNGADLGGGVGQYIYAFSQPTRENFGQLRVDVQLSDNHSLFVRHTIDKAHQLLPAGAVSFPAFQTDSTSSNQFFTLEEKWVMTPALLNTARFSNSILQYEQLPVNSLSSPLSFFPQAAVHGIDLGAGADVAWRRQHLAVHQQRHVLDLLRRHHLHEGQASLQNRRADRTRFHQQADDHQQPRVVQLCQPVDVPRGHGAAVPRRAAGLDPGT